MHFVEQKYKLNKNETESKIENHTQFYRDESCASAHRKNRKLKVTLMSYSSRKKKKTFFLPFILSKGNFIKICVLSQCIVYWIHFQNIHTFTYPKILLHAHLLLVYKIDESLSVSLSHFNLAWSFSANPWILPLFSQTWSVSTVLTMYNRFILIYLSLCYWFSTVMVQSSFIVQSCFGSFPAF